MVPQTDPANLIEAFSGDESSEWMIAVDKELPSLEHRHTWIIVTRPWGSRIYLKKSISRKTHEANGSSCRYKARLVDQGFYQGSVVKTYAPAADISTVQILLDVGVQKGYVLHQLDVKTAFSQDEMDCEVYGSPPQVVTIWTEH